ncbi:MAG: DUF2868 domain-containing protein [Pirellulales bacterium]|nr:DUF2868 domain-containing protein [Pirellulales bacterium]
MNAASARRILLVRAIEEADRDHAILPRAVRDRATAEARKAVSGEAILDRRAEIICRHLHLQRYVRWFGSGGCVFVAILAGVLLWLLLSGIARGLWGSDKSINILIVPLLLLFVWNVAYLAFRVVSGIWSLARRSQPRPTFFEQIVEHARSAAGGHVKAAHALAERGNVSTTHRALLDFGHSWLTLAQPLYAARMRFALHVAAFALVAGEFAFVYLKGVAVEFQATWESTWLSADATHRLLSTLLWPATSFIGDGKLPSAAVIESLKESPVNAAYWINLYLAQACVVVFVPRLVLSGVEYFRAWRLERAFPLSLDDRYCQNLIHSERGLGVVARVLPYSFHPTAATRDALRDLLVAELGYSAHIEFDEPLAYGDVDCAASPSFEEDCVTHRVLLFNLAQTPENEVHGALIAHCTRESAHLAIIIDMHTYRERLAGEPELEARLASRRDAWTNLAKERRADASFLGLSGENEDTTAIEWSKT